jgi:hypothetical protein
MPRIAAVALVFVAVLLFAAPGPVRGETCAPPSSAGQVTLTGAGIMSTQPFDLAGGAYAVQWQAASPSTVNRTLMLLLKPADGGAFGSLIAGGQLDEIGASGGTNVYAVKPGTYYLDVTAPGAWTITVTPR